MCQRYNAIDVKVGQYSRLVMGSDPLTLSRINEAIAELVAEKASLHLEQHAAAGLKYGLINESNQ